MSWVGKRSASSSRLGEEGVWCPLLLEKGGCYQEKNGSSLIYPRKRVFQGRKTISVKRENKIGWHRTKIKIQRERKRGPDLTGTRIFASVSGGERGEVTRREKTLRCRGSGKCNVAVQVESKCRGVEGEGTSEGNSEKKICLELRQPKLGEDQGGQLGIEG